MGRGSNHCRGRWVEPARWLKSEFTWRGNGRSPLISSPFPLSYLIFAIRLIDVPPPPHWCPHPSELYIDHYPSDKLIQALIDGPSPSRFKGIERVYDMIKPWWIIQYHEIYMRMRRVQEHTPIIPMFAFKWRLKNWWKNISNNNVHKITCDHCPNHTNDSKSGIQLLSLLCPTSLKAFLNSSKFSLRWFWTMKCNFHIRFRKAYTGAVMVRSKK